MTYSTRKSLYQKIETIRKRPLLVYVTSSRMGPSGLIGADVIPEFCSQMSAIPKENKKKVLTNESRCDIIQIQANGVRSGIYIGGLEIW